MTRPRMMQLAVPGLLVLCAAVPAAGATELGQAPAASEENRPAPEPPMAAAHHTCFPKFPKQAIRRHNKKQQHVVSVAQQQVTNTQEVQ